MRQLCFLLLFFLPLVTLAQGPTQTIRGSVTDKYLGSPLPGATVVLVNSDPIKGTVTDVNGNFKLVNVPVGRQEIRVTFLGYKEVTVPNILVTSGKEVVLNITLEEFAFQAKEVEITAVKDKSKANNELVVTSVTSLRPEEVNRFAGARQDPSRMAANYAGVVSGGDQRNDIIVRGNTPAGVLWRLEGVDIPSPNHFSFTGNSGGAVSILNNNLLGNSDFISGAFPAEYGNRIAAVFDMKMRAGNAEKYEHTIQAGLNGLEVMTEGPISRKAGSSYIISYRFFTFEMLRRLNVSIGVSGIPQFQDANFKLNLPTQKAGTFSIWGMGGKSNIDIYESRVDTNEWTSDVAYDTKFDSDMYATGASNTHFWGTNTVGKISVSASGSLYQAITDEVQKTMAVRPIEEYRSTESQYLTSYALTHRINARNLIKSGTTYRILAFNNKNTFFSQSNDALISPLNEKGNTSLFQAFVHWQLRVNEQIDFNTGIYYQNFLLSNTQSAEPRGSISWQLNEKQRVTFGYGLHSQAQPLIYYLYNFYDPSTGTYNQTNKNMGFTKSHHLVAGYQYSFTPNLRLKSEIYYQSLFNVPVSQKQGYGFYSMLNVGADYYFFTADSTVNTGTARNYGAEVTFEKALSKGFYFLSTLSVFDATYKGYDKIERSSAFDLGHVANLLAGKEFRLDPSSIRVLSADFRVTHSGGKRIIPIDLAASEALNQAVYIYDSAYSEKVKNYFRFDVKVGLNINRPKATHNFFLAADNLFNTRNELSRYWNRREKMIKTEYQLGLFPYAGYKVNF